MQESLLAAWYQPQQRCGMSAGMGASSGRQGIPHSSLECDRSGVCSSGLTPAIPRPSLLECLVEPEQRQYVAYAVAAAAVGAIVYGGVQVRSSAVVLRSCGQGMASLLQPRQPVLCRGRASWRQPPVVNRRYPHLPCSLAYTVQEGPRPRGCCGPVQQPGVDGGPHCADC